MFVSSGVFVDSRGEESLKNWKYMTLTLQWISESKLFAIYQEVFECDVQGVKKKLPFIVSTKDRKTLKKY